MVVKQAPATPAMPQPTAKVTRSMFLVLMPTAPAMTRFCVVACTFIPQLVRNRNSTTAPVTRIDMTITKMPLSGISMSGVGFHEPISQSGRVALTSRAPKAERNSCCMMRLSPQVTHHKGDQERTQNGHDEVVGHEGREVGFRQFRKRIDGIGANGHELSMGHVDDAHLSKNDGKSQGHQQQYAEQAQSGKPLHDQNRP